MYDPKHILGGHGYFTDDSFIYKNSYVLCKLFIKRARAMAQVKILKVSKDG
jgi:hypothetical protein